MDSMPARHVDEKQISKQKFAESNRQDQISEIVSRLLHLIGEDPERQGLLDTPKRFTRAINYLTSGYGVNISDLIGNAVFDETSSELVLIRDIEFFSLCEHHLLPFYGVAHVAYVPDGKVIGLSKVPRLVDACARRLQVQERLTSQIANGLDELLKPKGVAVVVEASHLCLMMRGVQKQQSKTLTKSTLGAFATDPQLRSELSNILGA